LFSRTSCKEIPGIAYTVIQPGVDERPFRDLIDAEVAVEAECTDVVDPLVLRISEEIAEFREQLRRGQEQIQAMVNATVNYRHFCSASMSRLGTSLPIK